MAKRDSYVSRVTPEVDEKTKAAASRAQAPNTVSTNTPKPFVGATPIETALGRDIGSSVNYNAMIDTQVDQAQSVAAKPIMSKEQSNGGGVVTWIGGVSGKYEIVMPPGSPLKGSKAAGWEPGRNPPGVTSAVSPTGIIPGKGATVKVNKTGSGNTLSNNNKVNDNNNNASDTDDADNNENVGDGNNVGGSGNKNGNKPVEISDVTRDAFAAMKDLFASYGLESLAGEISGYMTEGLTPGEALIKLKTNPSGAYAKRFAGNFARMKNGLNAISEATYLGLESSYAETLKAYGLGNMVSPNREDNYKKFADYIAADISAVEFKDRIDTVVTRVQNADPSIKATLKQFYPELNDSDLIGYFLNPKDNLPKLQEKVTASEIGAAAKYYNMGTDVRAATDLAKYGVDQKAAREGYSTIAGVLPTATKLGDIYNETGVRYAQAEGEAEVFKGNQDAATKRKRLASMERAAFSGSSGVGQSSLGKSTQGLL